MSRWSRYYKVKFGVRSLAINCLDIINRYKQIKKQNFNLDLNFLEDNAIQRFVLLRAK